MNEEVRTAVWVSRKENPRMPKYGEEVEVCMKFPYKGYEISVTTQEFKPEVAVYEPGREGRCVEVIGYEVNGETMKQAIEFIDSLTNAQEVMVHEGIIPAN